MKKMKLITIGFCILGIMSVFAQSNTLKVQYQFEDSTNLGLDSSGNSHTATNSGVTQVDDTERGIYNT